MATRLVPFLPWVEWERVGQDLFAQGAAENQQGLNRVAVWRYRGRVPVAVESTAELVEIRLRDPNLGCPSPVALPEHSLRCLYAMSIVRFVNGITDQGQKGRAAIPVASLAEAAGLPRVLVDIRHEAVHNELPSLPLLRMAARQALSWLEVNYWTAQKQTLLLSRALTSQSLLRLAILQSPEVSNADPTLSKKRKKSGGEDKANKKKQKTKNESDEKERARLVRELTEGPLTNLVDAVLEELGLSCGGRLSNQGPHSDVGDKEGANGAAVEGRVAIDGWKGAVEALTSRAPFLPSMLLSEAIERLAAQDGMHGAGDTGANGGVENNGPLDVHADGKEHLNRRSELKEIVLWLLGSANSYEGPEGGGFACFRTPLLKELLRRCLLVSTSPLGTELVRALMTSLAKVKTARVAGGEDESAGDASLPATMQTLLKLATVIRSTPDGSGNGEREAANNVESHALQSAAQKQSELLQALARRRSGASPATGGLEVPGQQSAISPAGDGSLEGPWSLAEDWAPCALGTVPSTLHPLGKAAELSRRTFACVGKSDALAELCREEDHSRGLGIIPGGDVDSLAMQGGPSTRMKWVEAAAVDGRDTSAKIDTSAGGTGAFMTTEVVVDREGAGAVIAGRPNVSDVADPEDGLVPENVDREEPGTEQEGVEKGTDESEGTVNRKVLIVDGLCLQGTVRQLGPEEQARIRESVTLL